MQKELVTIQSRRIAFLTLMCIGAFVILLSGPTRAQKHANKVSNEVDVGNSGELTPEQARKRQRISDVQLSPDANHIAMTVSDPVKETKRKSDIWIFDVKARKIQHFTTSKKSDNRPRWSPNGNTLAFLSNRNGETQIYIIPLHGGEAEALTESKTGIRAFEWSLDGSRIAFLSTDPKTEEEEKRQKEKDDAIVVDKDVKDARLRIIDVDSKDVETLTPEKLRISEFVWMPKGDQLLISATDNPRRDLRSNRLYLISVSNKEMKEIETPTGPFRRLDISPDGKTLAYLGARTADGPSAHDLCTRPLEGGNVRNLTGSSINQPIYSFKRQKRDHFLALAATGFTTTFYNVSKDGKTEKLKDFEVYPSRSFEAGSKILAFVGETATNAPELWISTRSGHAEQVSHFNEEWDTVTLIKPKIVHYSSFDGKRIEAALYTPAGFQQGSPVPFVVLVHGGPASRFSHSFHAWTQLLATRGYAVLCPNVRGSTSYGHDFLISNRYDWGGGDWKDVMAGVDWVIEQGIADPEKLGIGGWSYGGYMAAWAVTQTDRFKASVSGAPMTDLASEFGTESNGVNIGDTWALGTPYENLDLFINRSPVTFVKNVKTPTLLLNGEEDPTDPIGQCQQFYRGLRRFNVETEFVMYPRMGHGPREEKHQLDVMNRMLNWFEKYLK